MKRFGLVIVIIGILAVSIFIGYHLPTLITNSTTSNEQQIVEQVGDVNGIQGNPEKWLEENLQPILKPLGWLVIVSDTSSGLSDYHVETGMDILEKPYGRQLFVMEDILQDTKNFGLFTTLVDDQMETYESPTDEMVMVYLPYEMFNKRYQSLFNETFNVEGSMVNENIPDELAENYVYYDNRRAGANGVCVDSFEIKQIDYDMNHEIYEASLTLNYSERAAQRLGRSSDCVLLKYQVIEDQLILKGLFV